MRILVSTELLSPYRVDWLDELGKYAEVKILYLSDDNIERDKEWLAKRPVNCEYTLMRGSRLPKAGKISFDFIREIKKNPQYYDIIILDGYGYTTQALNISFLNRRKIKYFVNVDGIVADESIGAIKRRFKKRLISSIPYFLCGSLATNEILCEYGSDIGKIVNHPFTSLYERDIFNDTASKEEKAALRAKLGIKEEKIIISVGRFSYLNGYGKGYDVLLKTAQEMGGEFGWYIVGGSPTEEFQKMLDDANLDNFHFVKYLNKEMLKDYYRASDVFVLMTIGDVWGLVVNEAMSCALPVITTDKCMAGLDLVEDGSNGYIVPVGDSEALRNSIYKTIENNCNSSMGLSSLKLIRTYTIENMAKVHINAFKELLYDKRKD